MSETIRYSIKMSILGRILTKIGVTWRPKMFLVPSSAFSAKKRNHSPRRINALLRHVASSPRYLEIGLQYGHTFEAVNCRIRTGVDPAPRFLNALLPLGASIHICTSREFFQKNPNDVFDVVFIDGLHESWETYLDLIDSLNRLSPNGYILLDDVLPTDFESAAPNKKKSRELKLHAGISHPRWYGDVWRVCVLAMLHLEDTEVQLVGSGFDEHCQAVIWKSVGSRTFITPSDDDRVFMAGLDFEKHVLGFLREMAVPEEVGLGKVLARRGKSEQP